MYCGLIKHIIIQGNIICDFLTMRTLIIIIPTRLRKYVCSVMDIEVAIYIKICSVLDIEVRTYLYI